MVTPLHGAGNEQRRIRGAFVKQMMDNDSRSARYMAAHVGISNTAFSDRLKGKAPFLADELEDIARTLKLDPIEFYRDYINAAENTHPHNTGEGDSSRLRDLNPRPVLYKGTTPNNVTPLFTKTAA